MNGPPPRRGRGRGRGRGGERGRGNARVPSQGAQSPATEWEMNAHIPERFRGGPRHHSDDNNSSSPSTPINKLNTNIKAYAHAADAISNTSSATWAKKPEVPSNAEIFSIDETAIELAPNKLEGPWRSKEKYLKTHYNLLREDAVSPLRDAVEIFRQNPDVMDQDQKLSIYEKVHISGFTFAAAGIAARVTFSTTRAGKRIQWKYTKRLLAGTMVALTPARDNFRNICITAIVAARPLAGVEAEPPEIDIYFNSAEEIEIDPQQEWTMIEAKQGYFESARHTLRALQKLSTESFPLSEHICSLEKNLDAPSYLSTKPKIDLSAVARSDDTKTTPLQVDVLRNWPHDSPQDKLDDTQWAAMRQILTTRLSIIQGPPGTGKTHVSKKALQIMIENRDESDPPIIVAAQTNHALDQLLGHVSKFDPEYIRLGGRSTNAEVKKRALFEVRCRERYPPIPGGLLGKAKSNMRSHASQMVDTLLPLTFNNGRNPLSPQTLVQLKVITEDQANSLEEGARHWVSADDGEESESAMRLWLNKALLSFSIVYKQDNFGFEEEDVDLEFEQRPEDQDGMGVTDEEDLDNLKGPWCGIADNFTVAKPSAAVHTTVARLLDVTSDLWKVKEHFRGPMYSLMQQRAKLNIRTTFREQAKAYEKVVRDLKVGGWERDAVYLERANIIGMTTTGLSKYRALISSLKPKIILIEEAAEVIEAPVTVACVESLEHLILVGDHQQLQGHCNVSELENEPYFLNVSLFERLIRNEMPFKTLLRQRRMDPEFRRLLNPIYPALSDHPSVIDRPYLPIGLGTLKSFFFEHDYPEYRDSQMSSINDREAEFVAGFYHYLLQNCANPTAITILTFYNGQRKRILQHLKSRAQLTTHYTNVKTVDSYQGEENTIVILSLVRSNERGNIGFLEIENRVCVALSRAQFGFFIFGNGQMMAGRSPLWSRVREIMSSTGQVGNQFPITCKNHGTRTLICHPGDWQDSDGGCGERCTETLACGHLCPLKCHLFGHEYLKCNNRCEKALSCGHGCKLLCFEPCSCKCGGSGPSSRSSDDDDDPSLKNKRTNGRDPQEPHEENPSQNEGSGTAPQVAEDNWNSGAGYAGGSGWAMAQKSQKSPSRIRMTRDHLLNNGHGSYPQNQAARAFDGHRSKITQYSKPPKTGKQIPHRKLTRPRKSIYKSHPHPPRPGARSSNSFYAPEKQAQARLGWTNFAKGGVRLDDDNREKEAVERARAAQAEQAEQARLLAAEEPLIDLGDDDDEVGVSRPSVEAKIGPVQSESMREIGNGRKRFEQQYKPIITTAVSAAIEELKTPSLVGSSGSGVSSVRISLLD